MKSHFERLNKLEYARKLRNVDIFKDYMSGMQNMLLCRKYKISTARIYMIIKTFKMMIGHSDERLSFFLDNEKKHSGWIRQIEKLYLRR